MVWMTCLPFLRRSGKRCSKLRKAKVLEWLQAEVQRLDPDYWEEVDQAEPGAIGALRGVMPVTGKPYSSLRTNSAKERPFRIVKIGLERPREELYDRINRRVDQMMADGLGEEAQSGLSQTALNSLQTVGYRELFAYLDGEYDLERAIELIQQNTRHYAKRQMTWFRRDKEIHWLNANDDYEKNIHIIDALLRADGVQEE